MERTEYNPGAGKPSYLSGERVRLRAVEPEDLAVMYEMENDPQMWDISNFIEPYSRQLLREYIAENRNDVFADKFVLASRNIARVNFCESASLSALELVQYDNIIVSRKGLDTVLARINKE